MSRRRIVQGFPLLHRSLHLLLLAKNQYVWLKLCVKTTSSDGNFELLLLDHLLHSRYHSALIRC